MLFKKKEGNMDIIEGSEGWLVGAISKADCPEMYVEHDMLLVSEMITERDERFARGEGLEVDFTPHESRLLGQEGIIELSDVVLPVNVEKAADVIFAKVQDLISWAERIGSWSGNYLSQNFVGTMVAPSRDVVTRIARRCEVADKDICHIPTVLNSLVDPSGPGKAIIRELFPGCFH